MAGPAERWGSADGLAASRSCAQLAVRASRTASAGHRPPEKIDAERPFVAKEETDKMDHAVAADSGKTIVNVLSRAGARPSDGGSIVDAC